MLKQTAIIDVGLWDRDSEFAIFPQGARAKEALFSPAAPEQDYIVPSKRYLFKKSRHTYPDQFWGEIVAYRVGTLMGLEVPAAFAAWNPHTEFCGALIEWFYVDGDELCMLAGDFLTKTQPDFDRVRGTNHNLRDATVLLRGLSTAKFLPEHGWKQWWVNALMFDALIGNTDRHHDNWALLFKPVSKANELRGRLSPLFDNGTSLGHERFPNKFTSWREQDYHRYIDKGTHQASWDLTEPRIKGHFALLKRAIQEWPETRPVVLSTIGRLSEEALIDVISDLPNFECRMALCPERFDFICTLLHLRLKILRDSLL